MADEKVKKQWNPPWWSLVVAMCVLVTALAMGDTYLDGRGLLVCVGTAAVMAPLCALGVCLAMVVVRYLLRVLLDWAIYEAHTVFNLLHPVEEWLKWRAWTGVFDKYRLWITVLLAAWLSVPMTAAWLPERVTCDAWYQPLLLCLSVLMLAGPWTVRPVPPEELAAMEREGSSGD